MCSKVVIKEANRGMTMKEEKTYKQARLPNAVKIGEIILEAKGLKRSMAAFAEETGLDPSKLSRRVNGKLKNPLTMDEIDAIMANKSQSCIYEKIDLIQANGMISEEEYERSIGIPNELNNPEALEKRLYGMKTTLYAQLAGRGIIYQSRSIGEYPPELHAMYYPCNSILLKLIGNGKSGKQWYIASNPKACTSTAGTSWEELSDYTGIFLLDAWNPQVLEEVKVSFAFCDEVAYERFRKQVENARIHTEMTTILVDIDNLKVIKEEPFPGIEGSYKGSMFERPLIDDPDNVDNLL